MTVYNLYRDIIFIKKKEKNTYLSPLHQPLEHKVSLVVEHEGRKGADRWGVEPGYTGCNICSANFLGDIPLDLWVINFMNLPSVLAFNQAHVSHWQYLNYNGLVTSNDPDIRVARLPPLSSSLLELFTLNYLSFESRF